MNDSDKRLEFSLPALRVYQREDKSQAIYLAKVSAKTFGVRTSERFIVDYYDRLPGKRDVGYQRPLSDNSVDKVENFILKETSSPLLPTAILANSRVVLDFKEKNDDYGILTVNNPLYIIDGQHRYEAWKDIMKSPMLEEEWGDYELPIVILSGFKENEEIEQFYVINSRQKKIKTDLAQRHLLALAINDENSKLIPDSAKWQLKAVKIIDLLNEELDSIWKNKIVLPSDSKEVRKAKIISQNSFVSSLKPLFVGNDKIFDIGKASGTSVEKWANLINDFWAIVAKRYPEIIKNPHDYSLLKTVGVYSLHILLHRELSNNKGDKKVAFEKIDNTLKNAADGNFSDNFWRVKVPSRIRESGKYAGAFSSAAGHNRIAAGIIMGSLIG